MSASPPSGFFADRAGVICEAARAVARAYGCHATGDCSQSGTSGSHAFAAVARSMLAFTSLGRRRRLALSWGIQAPRSRGAAHG